MFGRKARPFAVDATPRRTASSATVGARFRRRTPRDGVVAIEVIFVIVIGIVLVIIKVLLVLLVTILVGWSMPRADWIDSLGGGGRLRSNNDGASNWLARLTTVFANRNTGA